MDLQNERRLEQFFRLLELPVTKIESRMEFVLRPFRLYVEYVQGRLLLSLGLPVEASRGTEALKKLLGLCLPARTQGVPLRGYVVKDNLVLSCAPPAGSDVAQWRTCYQAMRRLLEMSTGAAR